MSGKVVGAIGQKPSANARGFVQVAHSSLLHDSKWYRQETEDKAASEEAAYDPVNCGNALE